MLKQNRQLGMTFLGYVIVLGIIGFFAVMAMELTPLYIEYQSVYSIMKEVSGEPANSTAHDLRDTIQKRLDINNITRVKASDFKIVRAKGVTQLSVQYDLDAQFIGDLYFTLKFNKSVDLTGN